MFFFLNQYGAFLLPFCYHLTFYSVHFSNAIKYTHLFLEHLYTHDNTESMQWIISNCDSLAWVLSHVCIIKTSCKWENYKIMLSSLLLSNKVRLIQLQLNWMLPMQGFINIIYYKHLQPNFKTWNTVEIQHWKKW